MDILDIFEKMVTTGQPPTDNCSLLGIGYDDDFERLKQVYLTRGFNRGNSSEKFIIGPYGSGKTHFLRQLLEISREADCVTAEVPLSRDIDIAKPLIVYKEIAREIKVPGQNHKGLKKFMEHVLQKLRDEINDPDQDVKDDYALSRINALDDYEFEDVQFLNIIKKTLKANLFNEDDNFEVGCRWLSGEINDPLISKLLDIGRTPQAEQDSFGRRAVFSLCQFIKIIGFQGTVIGYDEAEQATNVSQRQLQRILSMARAEIDGISRIKNASVLIVYALTPDVIERMRDYAALQQRLAEPDPTRLFFDGNTYSPRIELDRTNLGSLEFLERISEHLITIFYNEYNDKIAQPMEEILVNSRDWAEEISARSPSISNRREIVKLTCSKLLGLLDNNTNFTPPPNPGDAEV